MRIRPRKAAFFAAVVLLSPALTAWAQVTDEEARTKLAAVVKPLLGIKPDGFLNIRRREDFEEDLYDFQVKPETRAAYFYEVSPEGSFFDGRTVLSVVVTHGPHDRYVAVSRFTGDVYKLFGFQEAESEFNRMAAEVPLRVSQDSAELFAYFYLKATLGRHADNVFFDPVRMRHILEWNFYLEYPAQEAKKRFEKWWSRFEQRKLKLRFDMITESTGEDFVVTFDRVRPITLWLMLHGENDKDVVREPRIEEWKLKISPRGECQLIEIRTLFRND